jgi:Pretoxin HINT domain
MGQIRVSIIDPSNTKVTLVEMPDDVTVSRLTSALASRMGLPTQDAGGLLVTYRLGYSRNGIEVELDGDSTLQGAGIQPDEVLRLYADMHAACFLPGTRVSLASGSSLPIEHLSLGAQVLSYDTASRRLCTGTVVEKTTTSVSRYIIINDLIRVSSSHLVYSDNRWQPTRDLMVGQSLLSETGRSWRIERVENSAQRAVVYNLHLSNPEHTFFAEGVLVHNQVAKDLYDVHGPRVQFRKEGAFRLTDADRRLLVSEITDAFESRILVKIINQIDTTQKEREATQGTLLVRPIFGLPVENGQYGCDAFMIMPFAGQFQSIYEDYIKPVVESFSLSIIRGDDLFTTRNIIEDIWSALARSRFIIADCTGRNANVFYELGIAHAIGKQTILLAQDLGDLPFDIQGRRAILYEDRSRGLTLLQNKLRETLKALLAADQA